MAKRDTSAGGIIPMEPGDRDRLVTIEQLPPDDAKGPSGFPTPNWTALAQVYAARYDDSGWPNFHPGVAQMTAISWTRWETGYRADCDPELVDVPKLRRLNYQGRIYEVMAANPIGDQQGIEWMTQAYVG